jgi:hypothetical protein
LRTTSTLAWSGLGTRSTFWLLSRLRAAKGPLAFMDASFMSPAQDPDSFYILGAVVVEKTKVFSLRNQIRAIVADDYFHATEFGRKDFGRQIIRQLADLLARETRCVLVVMEQLDKADKDAEAARELVTRRMFAELSDSEIYLTGTVVYERRMRSGQDLSDRRIFKTLKARGLPGSKLNVVGVATKQEPLLWAPDLLCWAFRQAYREENPSYFQQLKKTAKIIRI